MDWMFCRDKKKVTSSCLLHASLAELTKLVAPQRVCMEPNTDADVVQWRGAYLVSHVRSQEDKPELSRWVTTLSVHDHVACRLMGTSWWPTSSVGSRLQQVPILLPTADPLLDDYRLPPSNCSSPVNVNVQPLPADALNTVCSDVMSRSRRVKTCFQTISFLFVSSSHDSLSPSCFADVLVVWRRRPPPPDTDTKGSVSRNKPDFFSLCPSIPPLCLSFFAQCWTQMDPPLLPTRGEETVWSCAVEVCGFVMWRKSVSACFLHFMHVFISEACSLNSGSSLKDNIVIWHIENNNRMFEPVLDTIILNSLTSGLKKNLTVFTDTSPSGTVSQSHHSWFDLADKTGELNQTMAEPRPHFLIQYWGLNRQNAPGWKNKRLEDLYDKVFQ